MQLRDAIGFVLLAIGTVGVLGGIGAVLRDMPHGWLGFTLGVTLNVVAYRVLQAPSAPVAPVMEPGDAE